MRSVRSGQCAMSACTRTLFLRLRRPPCSRSSRAPKASWRKQSPARDGKRVGDVSVSEIRACVYIRAVSASSVSCAVFRCVCARALVRACMRVFMCLCV